MMYFIFNFPFFPFFLQYLVIELSRLRPSSVYEKKDIPKSSIIYDCDKSYLSSDLNDIQRSSFVDIDRDNVESNVDFDNVDVTNVNNDKTDYVKDGAKNNNNDNDKTNNDNNNDNGNNDNYNHDNDNNDNDNDDDNYRHQSIYLSSNVTSTELSSTRVSVESAQIHTAIRTRPYELKLPTYFEITSASRNKVNKVNTEKNLERC